MSEALLDAIPPLLPLGVRVVCLADRGFADTALFADLRRLRWYFLIRIKANFGVYRPGHQSCKADDFKLVPR